jgi:hypothetical protein
MWTFLPVLYSAYFALFPLFNDNGAAYRHNLPRLSLMLGLQVSFRRSLAQVWSRANVRDIPVALVWTP